MGNSITREGVVTPFVIVNFANGCIDLMPPRYFISFDNVRTCKAACKFTLTITYVPDTFSAGRPDVIHNLLLSSKNQRVTYQYGYYDSNGRCHMQQQVYAGTFYEYDEDVNLDSGQLTYNIKGVANVIEFLNNRASIQSGPTDIQPSKFVRRLVTEEPGFDIIGQNFDLDIDHTDIIVPKISEYSDEGILDIIMGKVQEDGTRFGGIVDLSKKRLNISEALNQGVITREEYMNYEASTHALSSYGTKDGDLRNLWYSRRSSIQDKLYDDFICFFDNIVSGSGHQGTFHYIPKQGRQSGNTFIFEYGNNVPYSDVLNFSVTYQGAVALAAVGAYDTVSNNIDAEGNNIGTSHVVNPLNQLSRNIYPTISGFNEDVFFANSLLTECLVYPFKAQMTVLGQIEPNQLLDTIYVVVLVNGTPHPSMTGEYQVLSITDNISSSGFTTEFELIRVVNEVQELNYETYVRNFPKGPAARLESAMKEARNNADSESMSPQPEPES